MENTVLSYSEFLLEKKSIQQMSDLPKGKGSKSTKSVKPNTADLPKGKGSKSTKSVKPNMADLPKGKGTKPTKSVDTKISTLTIKGKSK